MIWQTNTFQHEYAIKDHLGNARVTYSDANNDGTITVADIKQINHFYPFGLNMEGNWNGAAGSNKYQYNQKEWNDDFGLGLNDYGARFYDPAIARWTAVDPLGEMRANVTPYQYVQNNPMNRIDPTGMLDESRGADGMTNSQWMNASNPNNYGAGLESNYRNQNRADDIDKERKREKMKESVSDGLCDDDDQQKPPLDERWFILSLGGGEKLNEIKLNDAARDIRSGDAETKQSVKLLVGIGYWEQISISDLSSEEIANKVKFVADKWIKAEKTINDHGNDSFTKYFNEQKPNGYFIKSSKGMAFLVYPNVTVKSLSSATLYLKRVQDKLKNIKGVTINILPSFGVGVIIIHKIPRA